MQVISSLCLFKLDKNKRVTANRSKTKKGFLWDKLVVLTVSKILENLRSINNPTQSNMTVFVLVGFDNYCSDTNRLLKYPDN